MTALPSRSRALVFLVLAVGAVLLLVFKLREQPLFVDFLAMWTGGRLALSNVAAPYDPALVDAAQAWLLGAAAHHRPFPYPPTTLLIFAPLARLDLWSAGWIWLIATAGAYLLAVRRAAPQAGWRSVALIALLPASVWAALSGQCVFLTGALVVSGVALMDERPTAAGVLLGLAAAFKPTILLAAPAALVAARAWRTLLVAGLTGLAAVLISLAAFGWAAWAAWLHFAPGYLDGILGDPKYVTGVVTPAGLAARWGLGPSASLAVRLAGFGLGLLVAAVPFARRWGPDSRASARFDSITGSHSSERALGWRLTGLVAGCLLASPYAMTYETVLMAPGAVWLIEAAEPGAPRALALCAGASLLLAGLPPFSAYALIGFLALMAASAWTAQTLSRTAPAAAAP